MLTEKRPNLSDEIATAVRRMIVEGDLGPGERINEAQLALRLGISRTPLREALAVLAGEGAVVQRPRRGYFVEPLSVAELEAIYPIRPLLDPEALRLSGLPDQKTIDYLSGLIQKIRASNDPDEIFSLTDHWFMELYKNCPNRVLLDLIQKFKRRTHRYEIILLREKCNVETSSEAKEKILEALRRGDLDAACEAVKLNMTIGKGPIIEFFTAREKKQ